MLELEANWYDYGNRFYDPALARWHTQDLMAEFSYDRPPYNYVSNNPIIAFDPDGNFETKLGAWLYKVFHGGVAIRQDEGGEYYVYEQTENEEGADITLKKTFDRKGRSEGRDLKQEAAVEAYETQYNWSMALDEMGVEYSYTNDLSEARQSTIQVAANVLLPNALKTTTAVTNTAKTSIKSVDDLLRAAGKLEKVRGAEQGFISGNAQKIFNSIVKGGTKVRGNLYRLKDGTMVNLHNSKTTGVQSIDINKAGQIFKIRVK